jgi:hypothetical protein
MTDNPWQEILPDGSTRSVERNKVVMALRQIKVS